MGNNSSSCLVAHSRKTKTAKLMDSEGKMRQVKLPLKAGELMLEKPGHVICPAQKLRRTSRMSALKAEDELSSGNLYLLVPLCRVNCRVSEAEIAIIESACENRKKRSSSSSKKKREGSAKVLPAVAVGLKEEKVLREQDTGFAGYRSPRHNRAWSPDLDSISEE